jgi:hypothetical protein
MICISLALKIFSWVFFYELWLGYNFVKSQRKRCEFRNPLSLLMVCRFWLRVTATCYQVSARCCPLKQCTLQSLQISSQPQT